MRKLLMLTLLAVTGLSPNVADAGYVYSMSGLSQNLVNNVVTGQNQLRLTVQDAGSYVMFGFAQAGGSSPMSITDIYFDDHVTDLFGGKTVLSASTGVSFSKDRTPEAIDGGDILTPAFQTSISLGSSSISKGIDAGESLSVYLAKKSGVSMWNVVSALNNQLFRVGVNVQGFSEAGSETFVNNVGWNSPPPMVPEPSGLALAGLGVLGLIVRCRRRGATAAQLEARV